MRCEDSGGSWVRGGGGECLCDEEYHVAQNGCGCVPNPARGGILGNLHVGTMVGVVGIFGEREWPVVLDAAATLSLDIGDYLEVMVAGGPSFGGDRNRPLGGFGSGEIRWWLFRYLGLGLGAHVHTIATDRHARNKTIEFGGQVGPEVRLPLGESELRLGGRFLYGGQVSSEQSDEPSMGGLFTLGVRF